MKFLFIAIAIVGAFAGYISQVGYREATIRILENQLLKDESGSIVGDLVCTCEVPERSGANKFVCRIEESDKSDLLKLSPDSQHRVSYRHQPPLAILSKEDPYAMFIYSKLGFRASEVVGQFDSEDHSVVLIRQQ